MTPPELHTERLTLRCPKRADFGAYSGILMSDRAVFMAGKLDEEQAWLWFVNDTSGWLLDGHGLFTAVDKSSGEVACFIPITKQQKFPETELGWMTPEQAEGKGYAFEAAVAARAWAFGPGGLDTIVSYIDVENARSITLARRLGALPDAKAALPAGETADDTIVYRHTKVAA